MSLLVTIASAGYRKRESRGCWTVDLHPLLALPPDLRSPIIDSVLGCAFLSVHILTFCRFDNLSLPRATYLNLPELTVL